MYVKGPLTCLDYVARSLANNQLCGLDTWGNGTYTADGITKLCEGIKGSAITTLECALHSPPNCVCFPVSAP